MFHLDMNPSINDSTYVSLNSVFVMNRPLPLIVLANNTVCFDYFVNYMIFGIDNTTLT